METFDVTNSSEYKETDIDIFIPSNLFGSFERSVYVSLKTICNQYLN